MPSGLEYWIYVFYLSKFWELFDTFLLVLRGRPVTLLHIWHHSSVMLEVRGWLEYSMTIGVYGMAFNTFVHVIMYAYYAAAVLRIPFPLKRAITATQIVQFLTGFASLIPFARYYQQRGGCAGVYGIFISAFMNMSYLALFVRFYMRTYLAKPAVKKA